MKDSAGEAVVFVMIVVMIVSVMMTGIFVLARYATSIDARRCAARQVALQKLVGLLGRQESEGVWREIAQHNAKLREVQALKQTFLGRCYISDRWDDIKEIEVPARHNGRTP